MARIRTIKPEFFTSEDIVSLTPLARLFYVSLWCEADREGRLEWKPRTLKMRYFPGDDCDVLALGKELLDLGLVVLYEVDGKPYAEIPTFTRHQVVNNRESPSKIPPRVPHASDTRPSRVQGEGKGRKGKEGVSTEPLGDSAPADHPPAEPPAEPVAKIPLVDGSEYAVTAEQCAEWEGAFPAVSVRQQLQQMRVWCMANPRNRKTEGGVRRFIVQWLGKEQDRAPRVGGRANGHHATPIMLPTAATPDEAILRRISERHGGAAVERLSDGRLKCGVHYFRPSGEPEVAL